MLRLLTTTVASGLFAAAMWFAWLGWDHEYYYVDGVAQGPYRGWQVVGCALSLAIGAVIAYLMVRRLAAALLVTIATTIGFVVPWTADAASEDDSGLFAVGALLLVFGSLAGIGALLLITHAIVQPRKAFVPTPR